MPSPTRRRQVLLAAGALLALTGCGPTHTVKLGVRDVQTDILLSGAKAPAVAPPPTTPGFPFVPTPIDAGSGGGDVVPLPPPPPLVLPKPSAACPAAGAYAQAAVVAPNRPPAKPAAKAYNVRTDGSYAITGSVKAAGRYGPGGTRTISAPADLPNGAGWTYTVTDEGGLATSYEVIPNQLGQDQTPVENPNQSVPTQAGIYITSFVYQRADKTKLSLTPNPPLMVAKLPFAAAAKWSSHAVDAATGTSITLNGQTGIGATYSPLKARVDACGTVLDAYWVQYTVDTTPIADQTANQEPPSEIRNASLAMQFVGSQVAFGTQYGGLPIEELYRLKGSDGGATVDITRHTIYSTQPVLVRSAAG